MISWCHSNSVVKKWKTMTQSRKSLTAILSHNTMSSLIFKRAEFNQRKQQTWCKHVTFALSSGETKRNQWSLLQPQKDLNRQRVGTDLFQWENKQYVLVVDYFSRYIEIALLKETSSDAVIMVEVDFRETWHSGSCHFGQWTTVRVLIIRRKVRIWTLHKQPSLSTKAQSNGEAERAVQTKDYWAKPKIRTLHCLHTAQHL